MGPILRQRQVPFMISNLQHICVRPPPKARISSPQKTPLVRNLCDAAPIRYAHSINPYLSSSRRDVARDAPRVAGIVSPGVYGCLAPVAEGVEDWMVGVVESVQHSPVALGTVRVPPVVSCWCWVWDIGTCSVGEGAGVVCCVWDAGCIFVFPFRWDAAVVVFEVWIDSVTDSLG